jgi:uncharacterized membrane protein
MAPSPGQRLALVPMLGVGIGVATGMVDECLCDYGWDGAVSREISLVRFGAEEKVEQRLSLAEIEIE